MNGETLWVTQKTMVKNYLNESELNNLTMLFLDYEESMAEENQTDNFLKFRKKEILKNFGIISHKQVLDKAHNEYEKNRI